MWPLFLDKTRQNKKIDQSTNDLDEIECGYTIPAQYSAVDRQNGKVNQYFKKDLMSILYGNQIMVGSKPWNIQLIHLKKFIHSLWAIGRWEVMNIHFGH